MSEAAAPKLSATILLLRDSPSLQVLMVKRHYEIDFASGALVFPGGKAHEEDFDLAWADWTDSDVSGEEQAARVSAVREAFEESGILLARPRSARGAGASLVGQDVAEALAPMRGAVDRREASFLELMKAHDLVLALDALVHFGHWITPTMMPKRFDTHFYLAATPPGQIAEQDGRETTEAVWLGPQHALDLEQAGEATIIFPTRMNLGKLAETDTTEAALSRFASEPVITILPQVDQDEDGSPCIRIPEEAGYIQVVEPLKRVAKVMKSK